MHFTMPRNIPDEGPMMRAVKDWSPSHGDSVLVKVGKSWSTGRFMGRTLDPDIVLIQINDGGTLEPRQLLRRDVRPMPEFY